MPTILPDGATIGIETEITYADLPTYTYKVDHITNQIRGFTDELDAMTQAVEIILQVERYQFVIYSANAGTNLADLVGQEYGFVTSELKRRINDAFVPDTRIISTSNWEFSLVDEKAAITVSFLVHTVYGTIPGEMEVPI